VSCSDKILSWNVLGLQGSLLATLLTAPVYLRSVTIGGKVFSHGAVARALCCRAGPVAQAVAPPYKLNHPMLFYVGDEEVSGQQEPAGHGGHKMSAVAWCWSAGDKHPEVLDCRNGRPIHALQVGPRTHPSPPPSPMRPVKACAKLTHLLATLCDRWRMFRLVDLNHALSRSLVHVSLV
jgi:hypothetical protein